MKQILEMAKAAKQAAFYTSKLGVVEKKDILFAMADALEAQQDEILLANAQDMQQAKENGLSEAFLDRLLLSEQRIYAMAAGIRKVAMLKDPIGEVIGGHTAESGIRITKKRVPLGVVGIIYEARPNVTADAVGICVKTGNAVLLKGGKDALLSNLTIARIMQEAGEQKGLPKNAVQALQDTAREATAYFMSLREYIDVLIPRGGAGLIAAVVEHAKIPVIETGTGNCHVFVDASADFSMAEEIVVNAKVSRPSVCNAAETLLVHQEIADAFLPKIVAALQAQQVEVRGDEKTQKYSGVIAATEEDYYEEFLDYIISVKVVKDIKVAVSHINQYGTKHSEAIVTADYENANYFQENVDAAAVYVNASTRFTDGEEFGFGAEIGISTQKLHARGPMGLEEMTTYKYLIEGDGQIR